jgi:hypothetical protein
MKCLPHALDLYLLRSAAFLRVLDESVAEHLVRSLAFVLVPNHWHFVLWPEGGMPG